jgi:DNA helicase-2/ATP-dependent DNA helicase PcrA
VRRRRLSGQELPGIPSRFLRELPAESIDMIVMERPAGYAAYGETEGRGPWGGRWRKQEDDPAFERVRPAPPRRPQPSTGEITVHYDDAGDSPGLQVGARLRHPTFGVGEVRGWQGSGADLKVTMKFPGAGVKTILARFLSKP